MKTITKLLTIFPLLSACGTYIPESAPITINIECATEIECVDKREKVKKEIKKREDKAKALWTQKRQETVGKVTIFILLLVFFGTIIQLNLKDWKDYKNNKKKKEKR